MARIFVSHSPRDRRESKRMQVWLAEQGFENTFLDCDEDAGIPHVSRRAGWPRTPSPLASTPTPSTTNQARVIALVGPAF